ncbi:MAG: hypothetical protein KFF68_05100 [Desulfosarcina sp.]|nr:hypothetical protein [Desulfosarcina sp.]
MVIKPIEPPAGDCAVDPAAQSTAHPTDALPELTRPRLPFLIIPLVKRPSGRDIPCQWIRDAQTDAR